LIKILSEPQAEAVDLVKMYIRPTQKQSHMNNSRN